MELSRRTRFTFGSGGFWAQMLVAEGRLDACLDPWGEVWDLAAVQLIVEEAGGRLTDLSGRAHAAGGCAVVTNGLLHDTLLAMLAPRKPADAEGETDSPSASASSVPPAHSHT
nr:hypothetical protein GCM10020093_107610 [Planobispora longispora]